MALAKEKPLTLDEFLAWEERQPARYEFVDGFARLMTGGTYTHNLIVTNLVSALRPLLRGSPCKPFGHNTRVPTPRTGHSRYPDVLVDCGQQDPDAVNAIEPMIVFDVLSKSTRLFDVTRKVDDYSSVASIQQYIVVSQSELAISVWQRNVIGDLVRRPDLTGPDAVLSLHGHPETPGINLTMAQIFDETGLLDAAPIEDGL